jgi:F-type H+-transporting ATPase subunit epsilon
MAGNGTLENAESASSIQKEIPKEYDLVVVNMDKILFEGKAKFMIAPVSGGNLAILPGHTPLFTKLDKGKLIINADNGEDKEIEIENGVAKITQLKVTILVGF